MDIKNVESQFQLLSSMVVHFDFNNNFLIYDERKPGKKDIDVSYEICHVETDEEKKAHFGVLDLIVSVSSEIDKRKYELKVVLRGFFEAPIEMPEDVFIKMLKVNGCTALYSIARGTVSGISAQTFSFGNIVLPMVNFVRFHELEKE